MRQVIARSVLISGQKPGLKIYKPLVEQVHTDEGSKYRHYEFGSARHGAHPRPSKVVMMTGDTS